MQILALGVGEGLDHYEDAASYLITSDSSNLLLDCGDRPRRLWNHVKENGLGPDYLDGVFFSHGDADHCYGLPTLVLDLWLTGRTATLDIMAAPQTLEKVKLLLSQGYNNLEELISYKLNFIESVPGEELEYRNWKLSFARTKHFDDIENLAVRIQEGDRSICYSGDGTFTTESAELYRGTDFLIHDGYKLDGNPEGHASIMNVLQMAKEFKIKKIGFTHLEREFRQNLPDLEKVIPGYNSNVFILEAGKIYNV